MKFIWDHIINIVNDYEAALPLTHYLKAYYRKNPKLGSRDRKMLSEMAYSWYRCSKSMSTELPFEERMATCLKQCNTQNKHLLRLIESLTTHEEASAKCLDRIFPNMLALTKGIATKEWHASMLVQPNLFIRVRTDRDKIEAILEDEQVEYKSIGDNCLALPNGTPIDKWFPDYTYVVQDLSSQKVGEYFHPEPYQQWWDVCSGAGGKSLLVKDKEVLADITATDKRKAIMHNMKDRFRTYSHILHKSHMLNAADAQKLDATFGEQQFDHIICDVPCSGSGTWARTPEQMYFFDVEQLTRFTELQKKITVNASKYLKAEGKLFYITCSVFKKENDEIVDEILKETDLKLEASGLINGVECKADSMYVAIFNKPTA